MAHWHTKCFMFKGNMTGVFYIINIYSTIVTELLIGGSEFKDSTFHTVGNISHNNQIGEVMITKIYQKP